MKKIIVGFSKSKKKFPVISWLIRLYQCTQFSHTYIRILNGTQLPSDSILHASEGLVQHMSGTQFDKKHTVIEEYEIVLPELIVLDTLKNQKSNLYNGLLSVMHETAGAQYGIMQNIGILWVHIMECLGKKVKNPWPKGWNCSEFVTSILSLIYPKDFGDLDPNKVSPKEVNEILKKLDANEDYLIKKLNNGK